MPNIIVNNYFADHGRRKSETYFYRHDRESKSANIIIM